VTTLGSLSSVGGAFAISGAFTGATTGAFSSTARSRAWTFPRAQARIVGGATSLALRDNGNNNDNVLITDAGVSHDSRTGGLTVTVGGATVSAGGITVTGNSTITGTLGGLTGLTVASGGVTVTGASTITGTLGGITTLTATTLAGDAIDGDPEQRPRFVRDPKPFGYRNDQRIDDYGDGGVG
jgi:hypothetical protein